MRRRAPRALAFLVGVGLLASACGTEPVTVERPLAQAGPATGAATPDEACPLTMPPDPPFVPPKPYAAEAPDLYQAEWFGSNELWTMVAREGEVWSGLPRGHGKFGQKTFWWSEDYPDAEDRAPITVSGRQLDGPATFEIGGPGGGGFRQDIGDFMLVGIGIPAAGCWELTATYRGAQLSYVVLVDDADP